MPQPPHFVVAMDLDKWLCLVSPAKPVRTVVETPVESFKRCEDQFNMK